jgi:hypothetical protein
MMFTYAEDGTRIPFDPLVTGAHLAGCILCGRRIYTVGIFAPITGEMRTAVAKLRRHATPTQSQQGVAYGLCRRHSRNLDASLLRVELVILAAARKVTVQ